MGAVDDWLLNEGVDIAIALGVGLVLYIVWRIVVYLMIKAFYTSGIKARQVSRKATMVTQDVAARTNIVNEDEKVEELSEDEKNIIRARARTIGGVIRTFGSSIIFLIVIISVMDAVGAPTNSLLTVAALSGLAIALAVSNSITDFVGGLFILIEGSYNVGDIVTLNGTFGTVERMTLRVTYMRGLDGTLYSIPNGDIRVVANHNRGRAITVSAVGITYESDLDKCVEILNGDVADGVLNDERLKGKILEKPRVDGIGELAGSSVNIRFMVVTKPGLHALVSFVSNEYIHKFLRSELAYPTNRIIQEQATSE